MEIMKILALKRLHKLNQRVLYEFFIRDFKKPKKLYFTRNICINYEINLSTRQDLTPIEGYKNCNSSLKIQ